MCDSTAGIAPLSVQIAVARAPPGWHVTSLLMAAGDCLQKVVGISLLGGHGDETTRQAMRRRAVPTQQKASWSQSLCRVRHTYSPSVLLFCCLVSDTHDSSVGRARAAKATLCAGVSVLKLSGNRRASRRATACSRADHLQPPWPVPVSAPPTPIFAPPPPPPCTALRCAALRCAPALCTRAASASHAVGLPRYRPFLRPLAPWAAATIGHVLGWGLALY